VERPPSIAGSHARNASSYWTEGRRKTKGTVARVADQLAYITTTDFVAGMMQGLGCLELGLKLSAGSADGVSRTLKARMEGKEELKLTSGRQEAVRCAR
jgi:hypothetical protein